MVKTFFSVESRRELLRTVCLSGGVTQLPGLAERLQLELDQLATGPFTPRVSSNSRLGSEAGIIIL